jgi:hypothetical protein
MAHSYRYAVPHVRPHTIDHYRPWSPPVTPWPPSSVLSSHSAQWSVNSTYPGAAIWLCYAELFLLHLRIYIQDTRRYCAYIFILFATVYLITTLKLLQKLQALLTISYWTVTARYTHSFSGYISFAAEIRGLLHQEYLEPVDSMIQVLVLKYSPQSGEYLLVLLFTWLNDARSYILKTYSLQYFPLNFCIMAMGKVFAGRH